MSPTKPTDTAYSIARDARNLRLCAWLGLDPAIVFSLHDEEPTSDGRTEIHWRADQQLKPARGVETWTGAMQHAPGVIEHSGTVALDWDDSIDMRATVGPKPEFFTPAQKLDLERLRVATGADRV